MRTAVFRLLVLVVVFVAGGVTALVLVPRDVADRGLEAVHLRDIMSDTVSPDPSDQASDDPTNEPTGAPTDSVSPAPTSTAPTDPSTTTPPTTSTPTSPTSSPAPQCHPATPLVDPDATPEADCLAATLDQWQSSGRYGAGQELNLSNSDYLGPLRKLGDDRPAVIGFDLQELAEGQSYGFATPPLDKLLALNQAGSILTASWHIPNPATGGPASDTGWRNLKALVADQGLVAHRFWSDFDDKMSLLHQLQTGDGGAYPPAAVIFRPLHEANGDYFWWAQPNDATTYKQLYAAMQARAAADGVHNVVWGWSFNVTGASNVIDPSGLVPDHVDLIGVDTYEDMRGRGTPDQDMNLGGLSEMVGRAPRLAVTESGPQYSRNGNWDPASVGRAAASDSSLKPVYQLMWVDDADGKKQISSLKQGPAWLRSCPDGVCSIG